MSPEVFFLNLGPPWVARGCFLAVAPGALRYFVLNPFSYTPFDVSRLRSSKQVIAQGAFEPLGRRPLNILQDSPPMPTLQEMHKIVAVRPMVQANLYLFLDAITHQNLLCTRASFLGKRKYDPCSRWHDEPPVEDDFASRGDFGVSAFIRSLIKALEAQGRGFSHGHEKHHSEPRVKAIDLIMLFVGEDCQGTGAAEHGDNRDEELQTWMAKHRADHLRDAATKQYDSAVESARQFGCPDLKEVFTAEEKKRCRLDGGADEDGTLRLPNVEVVPAADAAHVLREKRLAESEGRAMRHPYRGMPLTGAPAARFPMYLQACQFDRYPNLDENGHDAETLDPGATEHGGECETGWIDAAALYITDGDGKVMGFRKADGSMASEEDLAADACRYARNFASDCRFCHVYNHSHVCKPTCFKKPVLQSTVPIPGQTSTGAAEQAKLRQACRFRFWRFVLIASQWLRRMGKGLVAHPTVAKEDDSGNEYGRCKLCRQNCFRGSTSDLCQACLRCNVDYQYQNRTFPDATDQLEPSPTVASAAEDASKASPGQTARTRLPGVLGWLAKRAGTAAATGVLLLSSFAVAMRSSSVADFYATKYLAKPQQWLATALGPLISGYRRVEEEQKQSETPLNTKALALRKMRTAIFAAFRSVWISSCEACLFLQTGGSAVQTHYDVVVHGHKGLFMMHECKRILNNQVAGEGLWHADLTKVQEHQEGEVAEVREPGEEPDNVSAAASTEDAEQDDAEGAEDVAKHGGVAEHAEDADADMPDAAETGADRTEPAEQVQKDASENDSKPQIFQVTISLRDDWLHRGDALQDMDLQTYAEYIQRRVKPVCGQDLAKTLKRQIFAFDPHYKLAQMYMQEMVPGNRRRLARFNMANCVKENVNEGEENAQFKAMHCTLLRCPGVGLCADPLMCAATLFPNAHGDLGGCACRPP